MNVVDTRCSKRRGQGTGKRCEHRTCIGCLFNGHLCRVTRRSSTKNDSTDSNAEKNPNATILDGKNNPPRSRPDPVPGSLPAQRLISPPHPSEKKNAHVHLRPSKYCHAILYKIRFRICVPGRFRASQTFASPLHISVGQLRGSQNRPPDEGIKLTFFPFTRVPGSSGNRKFHLPSNPPLSSKNTKKNDE